MQWLNSRRIFLLSLGVFLITHWAYRYCKSAERLPANKVSTRVQGRVVTIPKVKGSSYVFDLSPVEFPPETRFRAQKLTIYSSLHSGPSFGDWVEVEGTLNPRGYVSFPRIRRLEKSRTPLVRLQQILFKVRKGAGDLIARAIPEPEAALLKGILLGIKDEISTDWEQIYREVGVTHVVVASGYNVAVLVSVVSSVAKPFGRGVNLVFSGFAISLFALMLGAEPPILRAALMGFVASLGNFVGRQKDVLRTMLITGFLLLYVNPQFVNSISFQLSFASSLGLVVLVPTLNKLLDASLLSFLKLKEDFVTTLAASLFVFPLISFHFGEISPASFLVNTLTLWIIPPAMFFGFITVLVTIFSNYLGSLVGAFSWIFLKFFNFTAFQASRIFGFWQIKIPLWGVAIYYVFLFSLWFLFQNLGRVNQND